MNEGQSMLSGSCCFMCFMISRGDSQRHGEVQWVYEAHDEKCEEV